jgi:hypothetical protein
MGKAYANRKKEDERPESDTYHTPKIIFREYMRHYFPYDYPRIAYEPACGSGHISSVLREFGVHVLEDDIRTTGVDFLKGTVRTEWIITNPPFSLFDSFVLKAKERSDKFAMILKVNFFGAHGRNISGVWDGLKYLTIFDRQVDYRGHNDSGCCVGNLVTGIGIWDNSWKEKYWKTNVMDINHFCNLGSYKGD